VKLTRRLILPIPCRSTTVVDPFRRRALSTGDEHPPAFNPPSRTFQQVRHILPLLSGYSTLAAGDCRHQNPAGQLPPHL
jgi:hypothetical protein